jgi:acetoin utilization deacetylase AcuC-like enzyme
VSDAGYAAMAGSARRLAAELDVGLGFVLEGGYEIGALSRSLVAVLEVAGAEEAPAAVDLPVHPLAARARERLAGRWPALRG